MNTNRRLQLNIQTVSTAIALIVLLILIVIPLLMIFQRSFYPSGSFELLAPIETLTAKDFSVVFWNTIWLGICVVIGATVLAAPIAYFMAKSELGRQRWIDVVLIIPFMTPPYIGAMGWILFMQPRGYLEQLLPFMKFLSTAFFSFWGMVLIMSLHLFPFIYLILRNALSQLGGSLEEAAAVHGGGPWYRFKRIIVKLMVSSYAMGALLIFVKTLSEFGTPVTMGRRIGYHVLTAEIHKYTSTWPIQFGKAAALSVMLLTACMFVWYIQHLVTVRNTYRLVGGKGSRTRIVRLSGWKLAAAWGYTIGLMVIAIGVPYFSIITTSLVRLRGIGLAWGNYTLQHYQELFAWNSSGMKALMTSLSLSLAAATMAVIVGTFLALVISTSRKLPRKLTDLFSLMPNTVPGIVLIVGFIFLWNAPWNRIPLYNTHAMLALTYMVLFLPYTVQYVKANYGSIHPSLFQAARIFGGKPAYILRRILVPLILPGILAGWIMTFAISFRELVASLIIRPPSVETSATFIYTQFEQGSVSLGMAMAVVSVGMTTIMLTIVNRLNPNRK